MVEYENPRFWISFVQCEVNAKVMPLREDSGQGS